MKWIKVTERKPRPHYIVIICDEDSNIIYGFMNDSLIFYDDNENIIENPTHWMSLPNPPIDN